MLCNRCGTAIGTDSSVCVSCGGDVFISAEANDSHEESEKTTAQKVLKGCGITSIVLIFVVVLGGYMLLNAVGSGLDWFQDNVGCRVSSGICK